MPFHFNTNCITVISNTQYLQIQTTFRYFQNLTWLVSLDIRLLNKFRIPLNITAAYFFTLQLFRILVFSLNKSGTFYIHGRSAGTATVKLCYTVSIMHLQIALSIYYLCQTKLFHFISTLYI